MNKELYELTYPQKNIWLVDMFNKDNDVCVIAGILKVKNCVYNSKTYVEIMNQLVKKNDGLRLKIILEGDTPKQYVSEYKEFEVESVDLSDKTKTEINMYLRKEMSRPIDILGERLFEFKSIKYSENEGAIMYKLHHVIGDAWSMIELASQFSKYFENFTNKNIEFENEIPSYLEYINTEQEYTKSDKYQKDKEFFNEYLKDIKEPICIKTVSKKITNKSKRYSVKLDKKMNDDINSYCKENRISPYVLFLTALSTYIYRIKENNDFIIGTPVLNRSNFKEKQMLGMFVSTIPMRFKIEENSKFIDLAKKITSDTMSIFRHQKYPYSKILEDIHSKTDIKTNLYNIVLSYQNARANYPDKKKYSAIWAAPNHIQDDLDIHIVDINNEGKLEIYYDYLVDLFDKIEIEYLHTRLVAIIEDAIKNNEKTVEDIRIMSIEEENKILYEFNDTDRDYPKDKTVIDLFEEQVEKAPDNIALVFEDKKMTYKELNEKANQLAHYLVGQGVKEKNIVAVYMNRNENLIATLIAVLKCGATYIPIDPEYPEERVKYILQDSNCKCVITYDKKLDFIESKCIDISKFVLDQKNSNNLKFKNSGENLVYMIYTSGSTGNPKGVMISNKNLINFLFGINKVLNITASNSVVSITTISFDIFGLEIWLTLSCGSKMVLANEKEQISSELLNELCILNEVDVIQTTPSKLKMLTSEKSNLDYIYNMKKILLGGESLPIEYINKLKSITKSQIINVYGPTETTIWSTIKNITNEKDITAGKPISNTKIFVVDKKYRNLPIGLEGQLAISGDSVSTGYYKKIDLTNKQFVNVEYLEDKLYLTGDLATFNFDGEIKILGRVDFQIKLNGQRIELGEIESKVAQYENIKNSIIVLKDNKLVCFYELYDKKNDINITEIKEYLYKYLPLYMVPNVYVKLDRFLFTSNGKIDRKQILNYKFKLDSEPQKLSSPKTIKEYSIYNAWKKVFGDKVFGIDTDFFELGGDSLLAINIKLELLKNDIKVEYSDIFKYTTIRKLAEKISEKKSDDEFKIKNYDKDFSSILMKNKEFDKVYKKQVVGNILLTGVTGFLGSHILSQYIDNENGRAYCLIRGKFNVTAEERLRQTLNYFFEDKYDDMIGKRIFAVEGDITEDELGIKNSNKINEDKIDFVIHSAACVKHYGNEKFFFDVNIKGTQNVVNYCYKRNIKLIHISTLSVSGNAFETGRFRNNNIQYEKIFDETCFYQGQDINNIYVYTKFKSEEYVLKYMEKGLMANIIRCGNLTGRFTDLKFQKNIEDNAFAGRIKSVIEMGIINESSHDIYLEFTPIDEISDFIIKIMEHFNLQHNMFHAFNHNHVYVDRFLRILKDMGIEISTVSDEEFSKIIDKLIKADSNKLVGILNDLNSDNMLDYSTNIKVVSTNTIKYLKSIGFEWSKIDDNYVRKYIKYLINSGFIKIVGDRND